VPFMPPGWFLRRPLRPVGIRVGVIIPSQVIDPHGEQDGPVNQEITLGRGDAAPVSLLAEQRAHVPKRLVNGKNCKHGRSPPPQVYRHRRMVEAEALVLRDGSGFAS
jgi:hypothetical protein